MTISLSYVWINNQIVIELLANILLISLLINYLSVFLNDITLSSCTVTKKKDTF